jgi:hypothetical protein
VACRISGDSMLRGNSWNLEARRRERVERLARTEEKIRGLIEFIAHW